MEQTSLVQPMYSNDPVDFRDTERGLAAMKNAHEIIFQAELHETKRSQGYHFTDTGETPFVWAERNGIEPRAYFLYTWPKPGNWYGPEREHESDVYWLRKRLWHKLMNYPNWTRPSHIPNRPYTNLTVKACREWIITTLIETGIKRWMFDEMHMNNFRRMDKEQVEGNIEILKALHAEGHDIVANGGWHMSDPDDEVWTYPAMNWLSGAMTEYSAGYGDGLPDPETGKWWDLNEERLLRVQQDWIDAGRTFYIVCRWRPNETKYKDYESFALEHIKLSYSWYMPAQYNYFISNWLPKFKYWLKNPVDPPTPPTQAHVSIPRQKIPMTVLVDGQEYLSEVVIQGSDSILL